MLVDDATVAVESIHHERSLGRTPFQAIYEGARQVALPALAATLTICVVFVPITLLVGPAKYLFVPLALAVVFAMGASYVVSRTVVLTLSDLLLRGERPVHARGTRSRECGRSIACGRPTRSRSPRFCDTVRSCS